MADYTRYRTRPDDMPRHGRARRQKTTARKKRKLLWLKITAVVVLLLVIIVLGMAAGTDVLHNGAHDALKIHAVVRVEARVLRSHGGLLHDLGDPLARHQHAVLGPVQLGDEGAVTVVDGRVDGVGTPAQILQRGQVAREREDGAGGHAEHDD